MNEDTLKRYTSRKFWLALLGLAAATTLCAFGRLSGGEFVAALGVALSAYGLANVTEKLVG